MENLDFSRIHRFHFEDLNILLDVNSGSVHVIDQPTWDFLDYLLVNPFETAVSMMMEQYGYEETISVVDDLGDLMQAGQLFSDDRALADFTPHTEPIVKAICLHMAHDCNLRCGYCFADSGRIPRPALSDEPGNGQKGTRLSHQSVQAPQTHRSGFLRRRAAAQF